MHVQIFLNQSNTDRDSQNFFDGDRLEERGDVTLPEQIVDLALERAYDIFNVGNDPEIFKPVEPAAVDYFKRGNRSLSVGDVVAIDGKGYAVAPRGFTHLGDMASLPSVVVWRSETSAAAAIVAAPDPRHHAGHSALDAPAIEAATSPPTQTLSVDR